MKRKKYLTDYTHRTKRFGYLLNKDAPRTTGMEHFIFSREGVANVTPQSREVFLAKKKITLKQLIGRIIDES